MRRNTVIALIVTAILVVSATAVLSHPGWRGGQGNRGYRAQVWDKDKLVTLEGEVTDADRPVVKITAEDRIPTADIDQITYRTVGMARRL